MSPSAAEAERVIQKESFFAYVGHPQAMDGEMARLKPRPFEATLRAIS
jgi:hypothetical protein